MSQLLTSCGVGVVPEAEAKLRTLVYMAFRIRISLDMFNTDMV